MYGIIDMAKTRKNRKQRKTRKLKGGAVCYKTNKNGNIKRTWECSAQCGVNGACERYD